MAVSAPDCGKDMEMYDAFISSVEEWWNKSTPYSPVGVKIGPGPRKL